MQVRFLRSGTITPPRGLLPCEAKDGAEGRTVKALLRETSTKALDEGIWPLVPIQELRIWLSLCYVCWVPSEQDLRDLVVDLGLQCQRMSIGVM